jgi:putative phosphoesterase
VAALYDVHGNLPALEAVLAEVDEADAVVIGGDVVGGASDAETVRRLQQLGSRAVWIRGNAERELAEARAADGALEPEPVAFLSGLPGTAVLDVDGLGRVLFCHATPWNDTDIVTPLTSSERLAGILDGVQADVVVAGHTHMQDDRSIAGVRWVNAGSVGMPYEDADGAFWAVLGPDVELRRTPYDSAGPTADSAKPTRQEAAEYFESLVP